MVALVVLEPVAVGSMAVVVQGLAGRGIAVALAEHQVAEGFEAAVVDKETAAALLH